MRSCSVIYSSLLRFSTYPLPWSEIVSNIIPVVINSLFGHSKTRKRVHHQTNFNDILELYHLTRKFSKTCSIKQTMRQSTKLTHSPGFLSSLAVDLFTNLQKKIAFIVHLLFSVDRRSPSRFISALCFSFSLLWRAKKKTALK